MKEAYHIVDTEIPANQNFKLLKEKGLSYIQSVSGTEWTNLNPSDPGITILDQLCYALTELGYCNDFPVEDILTDKMGFLDVENQFYLPDEILTTAPVTLNDYIKLILDCIDGVDNAVITTAQLDLSFPSKVYNVFLHIDENITDTYEIELIKDATFFLLNKNRTLGELFLAPKELTKVRYKLHGEIAITDEKLLAEVLQDIQRAIRHYIFPKVKQFGYDNLIDKGESTNTIFNGPNLLCGWIEDSDLNTKKDSISLSDINNLITSIPGVDGMSSVYFEKKVRVEKDELIVIDIISDLAVRSKPTLTILANGKVISDTNKIATRNIVNSINPIKNIKTNKQSVSTIKRVPNIPKGTYRDINSYYSIQNTFPEIFPVGANSITSNASEYKKAQSLQLKGYLTLFDQILANQFSQLANVGNLFSFKNPITACPSDLESYIAKQDVLKGDSDAYPVPYLTFSPTYFYQSLYDIPHIKPLLKDNNALEFDTEIEPKHILEEKGWKSFKDDPYNRYIYGLKKFMEDDSLNYTRRNKILDHLLARHGESPLLLDTYIKGSKYTANTIQDKVIYKSLYLQNLGLLSYYRGKGYDYLTANAISELPVDFSVMPIEVLPGKPLTDLYEKLRNGYSTDFIFDSLIEDETQKLKRQNFIDFSAIELKFNLLCGLMVQYGDFIVENFELEPEIFHKLKLSAWMMQQRKGTICIETSLLFKDTSCNFIIIDKLMQYQWTSKRAVTHNDVLKIKHEFDSINNKKLRDNLNQGYFLVDGIRYEMLGHPINESDIESQLFNDASDSDLEITFKLTWENDYDAYVDGDFFNNTLHVFLPKFIPQFSSPAFKRRTELFFENELPIEVCPKLYLLCDTDLIKLIDAFVLWHNSLRFSEDKVNNSLMNKRAVALTNQVFNLRGSVL